MQWGCHLAQGHDGLGGIERSIEVWEAVPVQEVIPESVLTPGKC
jgi:hypothetical protein